MRRKYIFACDNIFVRLKAKQTKVKVMSKMRILRKTKREPHFLFCKLELIRAKFVSFFLCAFRKTALKQTNNNNNLEEFKFLIRACLRHGGGLTEDSNIFFFELRNLSRFLNTAELYVSVSTRLTICSDKVYTFVRLHLLEDPCYFLSDGNFISCLFSDVCTNMLKKFTES